MSFAEIVMRIAAGLGGWIVLFAYAWVLALLPLAQCRPGEVSLWAGTAVLAGCAALAGLLVGAGIGWRGRLRWLVLAVAPLALWDVAWIAGTLAPTTFAAAPLCAPPEGGLATPTLRGLQASPLERGWPPLQLAVLGLLLVQALRYCRPERGPAAPRAG